MEEVVAKQLASSVGKIGLKWSNRITPYEIHQLSMFLFVFFDVGVFALVSRPGLS